MSRQSMMGLVAVVVMACGSPPVPAPAPAPVAETPTSQPAATAPPRPVDVNEDQARRQAWLREVEGYVAAPATIPRLTDAAGRARFEALVAERAWLELDEGAFARDGAALIAVYPAAKALVLTLTSLGANDEVALVSLFLDGVNRSAMASGRAFIAAQPAGSDQTGREQGLEAMRRGAAINLVGLLDVRASTSPPIEERVMARLSDPATYAMLSAGSMQLFLVTLDDRLRRAAPTTRSRLAPVRAAALAARKQAGATWPPSDRTFEPLVVWTTFTTRTVVSRTGGYAVDVTSPPMVWRRETTDPGRGTQVWHHLEWRDGALLFEVACIDNVDADQVAASYLKAGLTEWVGPGPGRWFRGAPADHDSAVRVVTFGGRVCLAGVDAPAGTLDAARRDALLGSLRPAP